MDSHRPAWRRRTVFAAMLLALACGSAGAMHLTDTQGKTHTLEVHSGKWIVLNVWATWCAPCIKEMPELEALARARADVVVLGLAADGDNVGRLQQYASALRVSYPIIAGNDQMLLQFNVRAYPTTLIFSPQGKLVFTKLGQTSRAELETQLPRLASK